jgi:HNH endonuclease
LATRTEYIIRFWRKVDKGISALDCWLWTAGTFANGYGAFNWNGMKYAHVLAYELVLGSVPYGRELHHKCRNRRCVNPFHFEPLTHREHMRRHQSTLTEEDVREIRRKYAVGNTSHRKLGAEYKIDHRVIGRILNGQR